VITAGIDIGTSSVKVALVGDDDHVVASASRPLEVSRPRPGFSEQDPHDWWDAVVACMDELRARHGDDLAATQAIGLSGQMHGATLLDERGDVLRPCILWNDTRSAAECERLTREWPDVHAVTGNLAMPGFTAPKLMWVRDHEPRTFERVATVLLPKAYVRMRMCGERIERCPTPPARSGSTSASASGPMPHSRPRACGASRCRAWSRAARRQASSGQRGCAAGE
jgi:xylulokinase